MASQLQLMRWAGGRVAALEKAEARKIQVVKAAEADSEAKFLQGQVAHLPPLPPPVRGQMVYLCLALVKSFWMRIIVCFINIFLTSASTHHIHDSSFSLHLCFPLGWCRLQSLVGAACKRAFNSGSQRLQGWRSRGLDMLWRCGAGYCAATTGPSERAAGLRATIFHRGRRWAPPAPPRSLPGSSLSAGGHVSAGVPRKQRTNASPDVWRRLLHDHASFFTQITAAHSSAGT